MTFDMFGKLPIDQLMSLMTKYQNVDIKNVKVKMDLYDDALILKIVSEENIGEMFTDFVPIMFSQIPENNIELTDHRG